MVHCVISKFDIVLCELSLHLCCGLQSSITSSYAFRSICRYHKNLCAYMTDLWFVTFDDEPFITLLQHNGFLGYCHGDHVVLMLDYVHVGNAGWFAICIMMVSTSFISPGLLCRPKLRRGARKWMIYLTNHPITCLVVSCVSSQLHGIVPLAFARWPRCSVFTHSVTFQNHPHP